jgi:FAD/FMN-containing dehydrogenase
LNEKFIPPVIPGTLYTTLAGAVANDVHGKNNPMEGTFGHHIDWIQLQLGHQSLHCSRTENKELFKATIAGLGLTGIIKQVALRLRKASHFINQTTKKITSFQEVIHRMQTEGLQYDYQVAWLDLLNSPRAILSFGQPISVANPEQLGVTPKKYVSMPNVPMRLINHAVMKQFNRGYYHRTFSGVKTLPFWQFNNPLDAIKDWNRCYGKKGLLQFQAVFDAHLADVTLENLLAIIKTQRATPTLAVLKYFTQPGAGLLSFVKPGFTLAIDFINDKAARDAIMAMNQRMAISGGKIYLAKDLLLNRKQFRMMYPEHEEFGDLLAKYHSPMSSDLSQRLFSR